MNEQALINAYQELLTAYGQEKINKNFIQEELRQANERIAELEAENDAENQ